MKTDRIMCCIDDDRLASYTKRMRSGDVMIFYTGNDHRDFERYSAEGRVEMHDKPDVIRIKAPERSWYAELVDGVWHWLDGCDTCNGRPRKLGSYMGDCDEHNRCRVCNIHRSELTETPYGGNGWMCKPCDRAVHEKAKAEELAAMPEEHDPWDYRGLDEITCPYCNYQLHDSTESMNDDDSEHECPRCDNTFLVTAEHSVTFTSRRST